MRTLLWSYLGWHRFPRELSPFEVRRFFSLSLPDRHVPRRRFRSRARLGATLAVDTHGYTDLGMAVAKLLGFDLCPRLYRR